MYGLEADFIIHSDKLISRQYNFSLVFQQLYGPSWGFVQMFIQILRKIGLFIELDFPGRWACNILLSGSVYQVHFTAIENEFRFFLLGLPAYQLKSEGVL